MIRRLSPFFKDTGNALPSTLKITREQIEKWWDYWLLWRMLEKRVEAFVLATNWQGALPKSMLETFLELDNFIGKMEAQFLEKKLKEKKRA